MSPACKTLPFPGKKKSEEAAAVQGAGNDASAVAPPATTLPVGVVHLVDTEARFVLVRSSRSLQIEPGTVLSVIGDAGELVARVEVSPARKGAFLTADYVEGLPAVGHRVTMEHRPTPLDPGSPLLGAGSDDIQVLE